MYKIWTTNIDSIAVADEKTSWEINNEGWLLVVTLSGHPSFFIKYQKTLNCSIDIQYFTIFIIICHDFLMDWVYCLLNLECSTCYCTFVMEWSWPELGYIWYGIYIPYCLRTWKRSMCISDYAQTTFFYIGRFMKKLVDNQCSSISKGSIFHIK